MKDQVEISLKEISTSVRVVEKTSLGVLVIETSETLFAFRTSRWSFGSLVRHAIADKDGIRLSSNIKSVIDGLSMWSVSVV